MKGRELMEPISSSVNHDGSAKSSRPIVIYDGNCAFCAYWAHYWNLLTDERVDYKPYQEVMEHYPSIRLDEFQRAVQYVYPDGRRAAAAEATFLALSNASGREFWLKLYRNLPGFAPVSELVYRFIARHRSAFYRITLALWGRHCSPPKYDILVPLFIRLFGLIYLSAFVSFGIEATGLIGSKGILPLADFINTTRQTIGPARFYYMPMVFWLNDSDFAIQLVCWLGALLSLLLIFDVLRRLGLAILFILYLSLVYAGQTFMSYQWDSFLLETGFLVLLLSFSTSLGIWLLRWLLFRFMFMSGVVKLISGDPNWRHLTALKYHFFTQPLPTPLAWYAARLPFVLLECATACVLFIELLLPFLIFCPRRMRFAAAYAILLLETCILLTGNYNWFNFQTMLMCLLLFDDAALLGHIPGKYLGWLASAKQNRELRRASRFGFGVLAAVIVFCSLVEMDERFGGIPPAVAQDIDDFVQPIRIVNTYGLFAVMTTKREEIVLEGSQDAVHWREYEFKYKPGNVRRAPRWSIPFQPRLDWQMWFAALEDPQRLPWFWNFLRRLLENQPTVTALLKSNPFPDKPPVYIRAKFYDYTFSSGAQKAKGIWWDRRLLGLYFPVVRLRAAQ